MFIGYLNFFSFPKHLFMPFLHSPLGVLSFYLFIYKNSLHIKSINPFWQTPPQTL